MDSLERIIRDNKGRGGKRKAAGIWRISLSKFSEIRWKRGIYRGSDRTVEGF
jgi:hypothetical protein